MPQLEPEAQIFLVAGLAGILLLLVLRSLTTADPTGLGWFFTRLVFPLLALGVLGAAGYFLYPHPPALARTLGVRGAETPQTPQQYQAFAAKARAMYAGGKSKQDEGDVEFWDKVQALSADAAGITADELTKLKEGSDKVRALLTKVHDEQVAEVKKLTAAAAKLSPADQLALQRDLTPAVTGPPQKMDLPPGPELLQKSLEEQINQNDTHLIGDSFKGLAELNPAQLLLVYRPGVQGLFKRVMPKELAASVELTERQAKEIRAAAGALLASVGEKNRALYSGLTVEMVEDAGADSAKDLGVRQAVALKQLQTLSGNIERVKSQANAVFLPSLLLTAVGVGVALAFLLYFVRYFNPPSTSKPT